MTSNDHVIHPMSPSRYGNHSTNHVRESREKYSEYFMSEGCVPWHRKTATIGFYSYNIMTTLTNEPKMYKQNIRVSVGLFS